MLESDAMKPGETINRSPLDKPLGELTEEDILQLTREDCRRYLKEKGMRRPSWNKSQAIQQVISLKTLLETRQESNDAGAGNPQKVPLLELEDPPHIAAASSPVQASGADFPIAASASESVSDKEADPLLAVPKEDAHNLSAIGKGPFLLERESSNSPRAGNDGTVGQMTIFYCGKVNVYEGVTAEKARAIMHLAGRPSLSGDSPSPSSPTIPPLQGRFPPECIRQERTSASPTLHISPNPQLGKVPQYSRENAEEWKISRETDSEGPTGRKASVQRYLEKRKDRGRFKGKKRVAGSSASLEMYLPRQVMGQTPNGHSSRSGTCFPTQPRPPHTPSRCSSVENQVKHLHLSVDLNDDDVPESRTQVNPAGIRRAHDGVPCELDG